jgi:hypothetical protein
MAPNVMETLSNLNADCCLPGDAHYESRLQALEEIAGRVDASRGGKGGKKAARLVPAAVNG